MEDSKIESDDFPLSDVPEELCRFILEKLTYKEYTVFVQCNSFSTDLCALYRTIHFVIDLRMLVIGKKNVRAYKPWDNDAFLIGGEMPERVRISCTRMIIGRNADHELCKALIKKWAIQTKTLLIVGNMEASLMKEIIKTVNPEELECTPSSNLLDWSVVRNMKTLRLYVRGSAVTDDQLLNLRASNVNLGSCANISFDAIVKIIKEWINGEREIDVIHVLRCPKNILIEHLAKGFEIESATEPLGNWFKLKNQFHRVLLKVLKWRDHLYITTC